jgi:hypothetical protein
MIAAPTGAGDLTERLNLAFKPLDKRAFGVAVGIAAGILVAFGTIMVLVHDRDGVRVMSLLSAYFYGYSVTWQGVLVGFGWAFVLGFVGGWFIAFCRNLTFAISVFLVRTRAELFQTRDFLDHI